jgi:hypothetical protein
MNRPLVTNTGTRRDVINHHLPRFDLLYPSNAVCSIDQAVMPPRFVNRANPTAYAPDTNSVNTGTKLLSQSHYHENKI